MNLKELDAVIFDFGGVLINVDYEATIKAFQAMGINDFENLYSQANQSNLFNDLETGSIDAKTFIAALKKFLPKHISEGQIIDAWNSMIQDVPKEAVTLLEKLKKESNANLYLLSNTNIIHIEVALEAWERTSARSPYDIFDHVYLSHEINQRKPDPEIFKWVCKEQSLDPSKTLFIDDSIQHINGAKSVGLKTHHLKKQSDLYELFS